jgi:small conductance mechanosensitive channel
VPQDEAVLVLTSPATAAWWAAAATEGPEQYSRDWWLLLLVGRPLQVLLILALALAARWILFRVIDAFVESLAYRKSTREALPRWMPGGRKVKAGRRDEPTPQASPAPAPEATGRTAAAGKPGKPGGPAKADTLSQLTYEPADAAYRERKLQRAATVGQLLRSVTTLAIFGVAGVMVLDVLGLPVAPLLASAGLVGAALGFGAQNLVRDFVSGVFMLIEDQYGVGDFVDMGPASGVVESVTLRVTGLRDDNGTMWWVRNGEVARVGNKSQGWARAVVDVTVGADDDVARVRDLLLRSSADLAADPEWHDRLLEPAEVAGVEQLTREEVVVRVTVATPPGEQFAVQRELRERLSLALREQAAREAPGDATEPAG